MIVVIADDLTGAAEIAGIAWKHRLLVRFAMLSSRHRSFFLPQTAASEADVLVIATDTRSESAAEAVATMRFLAEKLKQFPASFTLFKKTDSALRGHIAVEISTLMDVLGYSRALLIPQNPSKGRIIRHGIYTVNGTPLHETSFRFDPEFPAKSSVAREVLGISRSEESVSRRVFRGAGSEECIEIADATCGDEIRKALNGAKENTLLAGAADFFEEVILDFEERGVRSGERGAGSEERGTRNENGGLGQVVRQSTLIVCGSTLSRPLHVGIPTAQMPASVFHGTAPVEEWLSMLDEIYPETPSLILTIGRETVGGKEYAVRLRNTMAEATAHLTRRCRPQSIIIEGGATAFAVLQKLGWQQFEVSRQLAPGVVTLTYSDAISSVDITLKPGSYPWGTAEGSQSK